ncbi:MAG: hypothetical protein DWI00_11430, partial [Planctomycetota bacterium]
MGVELIFGFNGELSFCELSCHVMAYRTCRWAIILAGVFGYLTVAIASAPGQADAEIDTAVEES